MAYRLKIFPRAMRELGAAYDWYESQQQGLGHDFMSVFGAALAGLQSFPERYPFVRPGIRRAILHRFPYGVFFAVRADLIAVLGVVHGSRSPRRWPRKIP